MSYKGQIEFIRTLLKIPSHDRGCVQIKINQMKFAKLVGQK